MKVVEIKDVKVDVKGREVLKGGINKGLSYGGSFKVSLKKFNSSPTKVEKERLALSSKPFVTSEKSKNDSAELSERKSPSSSLSEGFSFNPGKGDGVAKDKELSEGLALTPPKVLKGGEPVYPFLARKMGYEGTVILDIEVLADGRVGEVKIVESSGYELLDRAAIEAVKRWTFIPAQRDGKAVRSVVRQKVVFKLR